MHARDRLIFALDVPSPDQALTLVRRLAGHVGCFKIGLELFLAAGPDLVRQVVSLAPVFLDLKLHDIPVTVGRAAARADQLGVTFLTVHVDEGGRALQSAVEAAPRTGILGVTVLTSIAEEDLKSTGYSLGLSDLVDLRADIACAVRCRGIICSGQEAAALRQRLGEKMLIITPGVRLADEAMEDQKRIVTPGQAIQNGADLIVVGRPIRDAPDPVAAADRVVMEIAAAAQYPLGTG